MGTILMTEPMDEFDVFFFLLTGFCLTAGGVSALILLMRAGVGYAFCGMIFGTLSACLPGVIVALKSAEIWMRNRK